MHLTNYSLININAKYYLASASWAFYRLPFPRLLHHSLCVCLCVCLLVVCVFQCCPLSLLVSLCLLHARVLKLYGYVCVSSLISEFMNNNKILLHWENIFYQALISMLADKMCWQTDNLWVSTVKLGPNKPLVYRHPCPECGLRPRPNLFRLLGSI